MEPNETQEQSPETAFGEIFENADFVRQIKF